VALNQEHQHVGIQCGLGSLVLKSSTPVMSVMNQIMKLSCHRLTTQHTM